MNEQRFPKGWDEQRVKQLIAELDARTDEEWIVADEAAATDGGGAVSARGLRPRRRRRWRVCCDGLCARRQAAQSVSAAAKETRTMNEQRFPNGWDEQRVKRLIAELDARTDEEWIAADEAAATDGGDQAVITVPAALLPEIRRLLASHNTA